MISLKEIEIRNFLSFGNYPTIIPLSNLQQCFIAGEIINDDQLDRSNGAGKSSLMQSILWCLTGRTMHDANPGNNVLNWFSTGDCVVKLKFTTGEELTRIRTRTGTGELLFQRGGDNIIDSTLSTTPNMQKLVNKELNFDYDIFCGSVFCSQYSKPWLDMSDQVRKATLEKITGIDRLTMYAEVAKDKRIRAETQQTRLTEQISELEKTLARMRNDIAALEEDIKTHNNNQAEKIAKKLNLIKEHEERSLLIKTVDIDKLASRWNVIKMVEERKAALYVKKQDLIADNLKSKKKIANTIAKLESSKDTTLDGLEAVWKEEDRQQALQLKSYTATSIAKARELANVSASLNSIQEKIDNWIAKEGKICIECEQDIPDSHTSHKVAELSAGIDELKSQKQAFADQANEIKQKIANQEAFIKKLRIKYEADKIDITKQFDDEIASVKATDTNINDEIVKIDALIASIDAKIAESTPKLTVKEAKMQNSQNDNIAKLIETINQEIEEIKNEPNPYISQIDNINRQITIHENRKSDCAKRLNDFNILHKHIQYVHKAYSDRAKIKSFLIGRHIPYFNSRLHHYLESFHVDIKMDLTDSFSIVSETWSHKYLSGGERKQYDVAFMLAVLDLHENIHGKQSNILVLDEVDGRLDTTAVHDLITIVKTELAKRFDSIFIISHRKFMKDMLPNTITVRRTDRFSQALLNLSAVA